MLWGMRSVPLLPLLSGPLWPAMVAIDNALSMGDTELNCELKLTELFEIELLLHLNCVLMLNWIVWNGTVF